jgi:hypothetical protein
MRRALVLSLIFHGFLLMLKFDLAQVVNFQPNKADSAAVSPPPNPEVPLPPGPEIAPLAANEDSKSNLKLPPYEGPLVILDPRSAAPAETQTPQSTVVLPDQAAENSKRKSVSDAKKIAKQAVPKAPLPTPLQSPNSPAPQLIALDKNSDQQDLTIPAGRSSPDLQSNAPVLPDATLVQDQAKNEAILKAEEQRQVSLALEQQREALRQELQRQEDQRQEDKRQEALRLEMALQEATRRENQRRDQEQKARDAAEKLEQDAREAVRLETQRKQALVKQEQLRQEAVKLAAEKAAADSAERERQEATRQTQLRQQQAAKEAQRLEAERQEALRVQAQRDALLREAALKEAAARDAAQREAALNEAAARESAQREALRRDALAREGARIESQRQEAARQEAAKQEAARQAEAARMAESARAAEAARAIELARAEGLRAQALKDAVAGVANGLDSNGSNRNPGNKNVSSNAANTTGGNAQPAQNSTGPSALAATPLPAKAPDHSASSSITNTATQTEIPAKSTVSKDRRLTLLGRPNRDVRLTMFSEAWRQKVEQRAPFDMLEAAKTGPYENPLVTVALRKDGSVESVLIRKSSGIAELDEAIKKIIFLLSPFAPFTADIAADYDVLEIDRVWTFGSGLRLVYGTR